MLRKIAAKKGVDRDPKFRRRGHEIQRIETFSDAIFAFALTLLIVSLEVPKSFDDLMVSMRGFFAFGISFLLLALIWHEQYIFFRRYGLDDTTTLALNVALDFVVLFYVYPLKFLFTLIFSDQVYGVGRSPFRMTDQQTPILMTIYGTGFIIIYLLFFYMYYHASRKKEALELTRQEQFNTRSEMFAKLILVGVGFLSILMAWLLPPSRSGSTGLTYILLAPVLTAFYAYRGRRSRKMG
jgi:uncharacterized membrane protein